MRQTPVNDYLEEISTELPEELYGNLSDAIFETVCDFDEEVAQLKAENAKLRELCAGLLTGYECGNGELCDGCSWNGLEGDCTARTKARELGVEVDG